jgi:branched-chain amino acid transport system ATP-binding protein
MIEIEKLTVQFGQVRPLDALSARLEASIAGLIGPNGAGKTTLLNALSGFVTPVSGDIRLDGESLKGLSPVQRARFGLRRNFQQETIVGDLTVAQNVMSVADHVCASRAIVRSETERALTFCGLEALRNTPGRRLNLYQRRMTELARVLTGAPRLILLDEPGAGLNETETEGLRGRLPRIAAEIGAQVLLIDHDADFISAVCIDTLVIDFGRRLALGPTREVLNDPEVRRAYLGTAA